MSGTQEYEASNKIATIPNLLSLIRLLLIIPFLYLLFDGHDLAATIVFGIAAGTDWVDGQVARRTNQVSKLGQILDPVVDRLLLIMGVLALFIIGRLPLWIILLVLFRDLLFLIGGGYLLTKYKIRVDVIYLGKFATTFLYIGFVGILLNWPLIAGLGVCDFAWLPLFSHDLVSWGFICVYIGLVLGVISSTYYVVTALKRCKAVKRSM